jgi:maltooligosyltrehalose trehalohydrolase
MTLRRVWAPTARLVELVTRNRRVAMKAVDGGWWEIELGRDVALEDYAFSLDGGAPLPDPRSPWQPEGVHGWSRPISHGAFKWTDANWRQPPLSAALIYELHI